MVAGGRLFAVFLLIAGTTSPTLDAVPLHDLRPAEILRAIADGAEVRLPFGRDWYPVALELRSLRASGYVTSYVSTEGEVVVESPPSTYAGKVLTDEQSSVRLTITEEQVRGMARLSHGSFFVQPEGPLLPDGSRAHLSYSTEQSPPLILWHS